MTSAWKLLYIWKSRGGRSSEPPAAAEDHLPEPSRIPNLRRTRDRHGHGSRSHHRHDPNPLPRSQSARTTGRNLCRRVPQPEHESDRLDRRTSGDLTANNGNNGASTAASSRARLMRNNQLPEAVIQARQRLVERLGNVSLVGIRESRRASRISWDELAEDHDYNFIERGDASSTEWFNDILQHIDSTLDDGKKKPSSVSWEALCTLHLEVFRKLKEIGDTKTLQECCSICLESFCEGDGLIKLPCGHMFHPKCLQPWVRTCNDCPYCRAKITC